MNIEAVCPLCGVVFVTTVADAKLWAAGYRVKCSSCWSAGYVYQV